MARDPISVTELFTLPAQPTVGTVKYIPLGGDGFGAPFAAYALRGVRVDGDASSGFMAIEVVMDPRFCSLIQFITGQIAQVTSADADMELSIIGGEYPTPVFSGPVTAISSLVSGSECAQTFIPPPIILPGGNQAPLLRFRALNVNNDLGFIEAMIFLFNIAVRETTPMGGLLFQSGST